MKRISTKAYLVIFFVLSCIFCVALSPAELPLSNSDAAQVETSTETSIPVSVSALTSDGSTAMDTSSETIATAPPENSLAPPQETVTPVISTTSAPTSAPSAAPNTGFFKKKGSTYYRLANGKLKTGWLKYNGHKYYFYKNHKMAKNVIIDHKYKINKKGRVVKTFNKQEVKARKYAAEVLKNITKKGMSKSQKLYAAYSYIVKNTSYVDQNDLKPGSKNWAAKCASHTLKYETGECYGFAAAFAYLAKEIGYENSYVCYGTTRSSSYPWAPHGWAEIKIGKKTYLFDPEIEYKNRTCGRLYKKEYGQVLRKYEKKGRQ